VLHTIPHVEKCAALAISANKCFLIPPDFVTSLYNLAGYALFNAYEEQQMILSNVQE
jgi:hypothetical protein